MIDWRAEHDAMDRRIRALSKVPAKKAPNVARTKSLANVLKEWRAARGLSASAAAEFLGLPSRTLEGIEQGRPFRYEKMLRLALNAP